MATSKNIRSVRRTQPSRPKKQSPRKSTYKRKTGSSSTSKLEPGNFALQERTLPSRRFVEFPLAKGKVTERVQLFFSEDAPSLTIEFQDKTSLYLILEPNLTIRAHFQQDVKGELETLAEWPAIRSEVLATD